MTSCTHLTLLSIAKLYIFVNRISAIASRLSFCYSILITKVYPNAYLHNIFTVNKERSMTQGVSIATKKDGTVYYRAGLYYKNKHISLGSYADETTAGNAYLEALAILGSLDQLPEDYIKQPTTLSFDKLIVSSGNSVRADAVAGEDGILHAIVADEQMPLPFLDLAAGIVEQVVNVKL